MADQTAVADDTVTFESPVVRDYAISGTGELILVDASVTTKWLVRAAADGEVARHLDVAFGASRCHGNAMVLGSRPGEWIILGLGDAVAEIVAGVAEVAGSEHATVLDWTHGRALFRLTGGDAASLLEKVCNLDWSDPLTPDGAVVSGSVAKVTCDLARDDADDNTPSYLIACDRSFGQYLFDALIDAGREFGVTVGPPQP